VGSLNLKVLISVFFLLAVFGLWGCGEKPSSSVDQKDYSEPGSRYEDAQCNCEELKNTLEEYEDSLKDGEVSPLFRQAVKKYAADLGVFPSEVCFSRNAGTTYRDGKACVFVDNWAHLFITGRVRHSRWDAKEHILYLEIDGTPRGSNRVFYLACKDGAPIMIVNSNGGGLYVESDGEGATFPPFSNLQGRYVHIRTTFYQDSLGGSLVPLLPPMTSRIYKEVVSPMITVENQSYRRLPGLFRYGLPTEEDEKLDYKFVWLSGWGA